MSWWTSPTLHPKTKSKFVVVFSDVFYLPNVKSINKPSVEIETKEYRLLNHTFNYPGNAKWKPVTLKFVDMNGMGSKTEFFDTSAFLWQILNNTGYAYPYLDNSSTRDPHYKNVAVPKSKKIKVKTPYIDSAGHHISTGISFDDSKTWRTITTPEKSSNIANSFGAGLEGKIDKLPAGIGRQRIAIYQISPGEKPVITEAWYLVNPIVKSINWGDLSYDSEELVEYELQIVYDWAVLDRTVIGDVLEVDEKPYQQFMKTLHNNKETIDEEFRERAAEAADQFVKESLATTNKMSSEEIEAQIDRLIALSSESFDEGVVDLDGDGKISEFEQRAGEDARLKEAFRESAYDTLEGLNEEFKQAEARENIEVIEAASEKAKAVDDFMGGLEYGAGYATEPIPDVQMTPAERTQSGTGGLDNAPEIANIDETQNTEEHGEQRIGDLSGGGTIEDLGWNDANKVVRDNAAGTVWASSGVDWGESETEASATGMLEVGPEGFTQTQRLETLVEENRDSDAPRESLNQVQQSYDGTYDMKDPANENSRPIQETFEQNADTEVIDLSDEE